MQKGFRCGREYSQLNTLNLFKSISKADVPVQFIHGRQDGVAPYAIAFSFYEHLQAERKAFTSSDGSAHMPHYDEPDKFAGIVTAQKGS